MISGQSLTCPKGASLTFEIDMDTGSDLTGATAQWALCESWFDQAKVYLTKTGAGDGLFIGQDAGVWKITVNLAPTDTLDIPSGLLYHDCKVLLQNGDVEDVANGPFSLDPSVNILLTNAPITRNVSTTQSLGSLSQSATATVTAPALSAEAAQFFDRVAALPDATRQGLYVSLIDGLVSDGVWAKLDALYIYAAQGMGNASLVNLISTSYPGKFIHTGGSVMTFTPDRGFNGAGAMTASCIGTSFFSSGTNYHQNDAMVAIWQVGSALEDNPILGEAPDPGLTIIYTRATNNQNIYMVNVDSSSGAYVRTVISDDPNGFWLAQRTAFNASEISHNDSPIATSSGVSSANAGEIMVDPQINIAAALALGGSLTGTQKTALYNRLHTYMVAVGAA
jgi:hypothetical protein